MISRFRTRWRLLQAGPVLVRSAGYGFAAIVLIQGTLIAQHVIEGRAPKGESIFAASEFSLEPAAGPDPSDGPADETASQALLADPDGRQTGCDPQLLRAIEERSRQLDALSSDLADRARMLEVIEARAAEQVRALEAQREALQTTLAGVEKGAEAEIARLVKIYENMKPKEAAEIFETMPVEVAAGLMRRMSERDRKSVV